MKITRRSALAAVPALAAPAFVRRLTAAPNSKFGGVQIGVIAPYAFQGMAPDIDTIVKHCAELGIGGVELQNNPVEAYAGAPRGGGRGPGRGATLTPEQQEAQRKAAEALKSFRLGASMDKFKEVRKKFNDAGIEIYAYKFEYNLAPLSDEEFDYSFNVASTLGANHVTLELPNDPALTKRIGEFAAKKRMNVGYHAHGQSSLTAWDEAISQSPRNGLNLDVGHHTMANNADPIPLMRKHSSRIYSLHLKDRKFQKDGGQNMPWGQGNTPLKEILQLVKREKWTFPCTIELEYRVEGSNAAAEIAKCLQFCKDALA